MREQPLLAWQWQAYPSAHRDRRNLVIHVTTWPFFCAGTLALALGWLISPWLMLGGIAMPLAMALQGRGHRLEREPPAPFEGPLDVVGRIFAEQWITFPRFLASGGFARAWRESSRG